MKGYETRKPHPRSSLTNVGKESRPDPQKKWQLEPDEYESSALAYERALQELGELPFPELEVALKHLNMDERARKRLTDFYEGKLPLADAIETLRGLDEARSRIGDAPRMGKVQAREMIRLYRERNNVLATDEQLAQDAERLVRIEARFAGDLFEIREIAQRLRDRFPTNAEIAQTVEALLEGALNGS